MKNNLLTEQLAYNGDSRTKTHIHLIRYSAGTFEETLLDAFTPEAVAVGADEKIWLRIHGLKDAACIEAVCTHFGADFLTIQDILNADHPSKVEEHDGSISWSAGFSSRTVPCRCGSCRASISC